MAMRTMSMFLVVLCAAATAHAMHLRAKPASGGKGSMTVVSESHAAVRKCGTPPCGGETDKVASGGEASTAVKIDESKQSDVHPALATEGTPVAVASPKVVKESEKEKVQKIAQAQDSGRAGCVGKDCPADKEDWAKPTYGKVGGSETVLENSPDVHIVTPPPCGCNCQNTQVHFVTVSTTMPKTPAIETVPRPLNLIQEGEQGERKPTIVGNTKINGHHKWIAKASPLQVHKFGKPHIISDKVMPEPLWAKPEVGQVDPQTGHLVKAGKATKDPTYKGVDEIIPSCAPRPCDCSAPAAPSDATSVNTVTVKAPPPPKEKRKSWLPEPEPTPAPKGLDTNFDALPAKPTEAESEAREQKPATIVDTLKPKKDPNAPEIVPKDKKADYKVPTMSSKRFSDPIMV
jgi:hypothetical protein